MKDQGPRWFRWYVVATTGLMLILGVAAFVLALLADSIGEGLIRGAVAVILIVFGIRRVRLSTSN